MVRYAVLLKFSEKGLSGISNSPSRAAAFCEQAAAAGITVESQLWTMGEYDGLLIISADDEQTAVAHVLKLSSELNVKTSMLRAFNAEEFGSVLSRLNP